MHRKCIEILVFFKIFFSISIAIEWDILITSRADVCCKKKNKTHPCEFTTQWAAF